LSEKKYSMWFAKRRESTVMDGVKEHILKVLDTCEEMENAIAAILRKDEAGARQAIERLYKDEKAADNIEIILNKNLAIGDLDPKEREDLMHMVNRIDHIADWAKSAARNIEILMDAKIDVPEKIWRNIQNLGHRVVEGAREVKLAIDYLGEDPDKFLVHHANVDRIEHEIDDLYFEAKKDLMMSMTLDPRVMFVMRDIIHGLENAADNCKEAVDHMHIIQTANR
jgi:predicted phosphate transport protein (TIGR00153 family)